MRKIFKNSKRKIAAVMAGALVLSGISYLNVDVNAAGKVALSSKKVTVTIGKTKVLKQIGRASCRERV